MGEPNDKPKDETKAPEFQRVLKNLLATPHKPQSELKVGRKPAKRKGAAKDRP
jgi:hypothetical protein